MKFVRIIAAIFVASVSLALFWLGMAVIGVTSEAQHSAVKRALGYSFERQFQLDRWDKVGQPIYMDYKLSVPALSNDLDAINCSTKVVTRDMPAGYLHETMTKVVKYSPIQAIVFYTGPEIDFGKVLNVEFVPNFLGPLPYLLPPNAPQKNIFLDDIRGNYKKEVQGKKFIWNSTLCAEFTYSVIQEISQ